MRIIVTTTVELAPGHAGDPVTSSTTFTERRVFTEHRPAHYVATAADAMGAADAGILSSLVCKFGDQS